MVKTIFGSKSEKENFRKLVSHWEKYVAIYPQVSVKNVIGYDELEQLPMPKKAIEYLKKTEFDYVVCEKDSGAPIIAIEFDGIGHGFSRNGEYFSKVIPIDAPNRKIKLDNKLEACTFTDTPLVIISYDECKLNNEDQIMIIDAIIGQAIEKKYYEKNY